MHISTPSANRSFLGGLVRSHQRKPRSGERRLRVESLEARQMLTAFPLVAADTVVRAIAVGPTAFNDMGTDWTGGDALFDDSSWATSTGEPNGVGYDTTTALNQYIGVNLGSTAYSSGTNTMYVRIPFEMTQNQVDTLEQLRLDLRHDAGYIVYLNGHEILRDGVGTATNPPFNFNSTTTNPTPDDFDSFNIFADHKDKLQSGTNVLAIRGANESFFGSPGFDQNFLIQAQLTGDDAPVDIATVADDAFEVEQEVTTFLDVLANDRLRGNEIDPTNVTILITEDPKNGVIVKEPDTNQAKLNELGQIEYKGSVGFIGEDTFSYKVQINTDPLSNEATVSVSLRGPNPIAVADNISVNQGTTTSNIDILGNDETGVADDPLDPTTVTLTSGMPDGAGGITTDNGNRVEVNADGTINFIHTSNNSLDDSFTYTVRDTGTTAPAPQTLVAETAAATAIVPADATLGTTWTGGAEPYDDSAWTTGNLGVGYARAFGDAYDDFIGNNFDFQTEMDSTGRPSVYIRVPFDMSTIDLAHVENLTLNMRYDDGFIAYINGAEVERANFAGVPAWNSTADAGHNDGAAVEFVAFDITEHIDKLLPGENILAIQGMNSGANSSDLLIQPQLVAGVTQIGRLSNEATVHVHVNANPETAPDFATVKFNTTLDIPVLDNDKDPDNSPNGAGQFGLDPTTVEILSDPHVGAVTANHDGTITFDSAGVVFNETTTFTYRVQDYEGAWSAAETVEVTLGIVRPTATDDYEVTPIDESIDIDVVNREADSGGDFALNKLNVQVETTPENGTVLAFQALTPQGSVTKIRYTPNPGFVGRNTFTYTVADVNGNRSDPATVTVDVYHRAIAENNVFQTDISQDLSFTAADLAANDSVPTGFTVRVGNGNSVITTEQGGKVTLAGGAYTYSPPSNGFIGTDRFRYLLEDTTLAQPPLPYRPKADSNTAIVEIVSGGITVEGYVYVDINQDGVRDDSEYNVADSTITLTSPDNPSLHVEVKTNDQGYYRIESSIAGALPPGTYTITQSQPSMFLDFESNPVNQYANIEFTTTGNSAGISSFDFREWAVNQVFFTSIVNYGAGFAASGQHNMQEAGALVVPYDAGWDGSFVAEANYADEDGTVQIALYNAQGTQLAIAQSGEGEQGHTQLDWDAAAGEPLVLIITGTNTAVSVDVPTLSQSSDDTSPPIVLDILLSSSQWSTSVLDLLNENGQGDGGYSLWNSPAPLPWNNLDQIRLRFSENVNVTQEDLKLWGLNVEDYVAAEQVTDFAYDPISYTGIWTLADPLDVDRLRVGLDSLVDDMSGNRLANENFHMAAAVHPGAENIYRLLSQYGSTIGDARYSIMTDVDGNGTIGLSDIAAIRRRDGIALPSGTPGPAASSPQAAAAVVQSIQVTNHIQAPDGGASADGPSGEGVDAAIFAIETRGRRPDTAQARRLRREVRNLDNHTAEDRHAATDSILSQINPRNRRSLTSGLSHRAPRSNPLVMFDHDGTADDH